MCRSTECHGVFHKERDRMRFRAFYILLSVSMPKNAVPETLTLLYLPRINGTFLEINGAKIRPESAAYVALHRVRCAEKHAVFASTDRARVCEGVRFEVYAKEERVLKGIFRKDEEDLWKLDCQSAMEKDLGISEAEVGVAGERCGVVKERVEMVARRRNRRGWFGLEEIPEEREIDFDGCDCGETGMESDGEDSEEEKDRTVQMEEQLNMEGVRWAVDLGFWVMCLGVGILASMAPKVIFGGKKTRRKPTW